ncbi:MAG TPA: helix-turn-helix domain-containing protein [Conexibacter sp.]|nr:helix-turn-helix domain-containing protein [Conexibacter sp.]
MTRTYQQRRRAEQQEETRLRIVEAAIELHATTGPARTTMSAVAERAGVQRNTLYRHFPDERALLDACSGLHGAQHPLPSPDAWAEIEDPVARARHGLSELYAYWEANEAMVANVLRDAEVHAATREVSRRSWGPPLAAMRQTLLAAWPRGRGRRRLEAAVELALDFRTWQSLVRGSGLGGAAAADLMATTLGCVAAHGG